MQLEFKVDGANALCQWGAKHPYPGKYSIGTATLSAAVAGFQVPLKRLTEWARSGPKERLPDILHEIAVAGQRLRFVLFSPKQDIREMKDWIAEQYESGDRSLEITADPDFHIPWGLIYDGDPGAIPDGAKSIEDFEKGFWLFKYDLSILFSSCVPVSARRAKRPKASFRMLSLIDRGEYQYIADNAAYQRIINLPVGPAYDIKTCDELIKAAAAQDTLFYFFGHGTNGGLVVGTEQVDAIKFDMMMNDLTNRRDGSGTSSIGLVFLNACESALGQADYSLRSKAARPGLCGLIATEAEVPRDFAIEFGLSFLRSLIEEGKSVGETMEAHRRCPQWWPLSLLYGCYACLEYRIA